MHLHQVLFIGHEFGHNLGLNLIINVQIKYHDVFLMMINIKILQLVVKLMVNQEWVMKEVLI